MPERNDRPAAGCDSLTDTHSLLISLAGLIDDELLGWSRELVAVGETDYALELVTAAITAERTRLPDPVHARLRAARRQPPGEQLPAPDPTVVMKHRFLADPATAGHPSALAAAFPTQALHTLPARLLRGCRMRLSWRLTPAGSAPAPVPHPVLLIETTDATGADLLAYQVADLLWQSGVFASVEVLGPDTALGEYHRAALGASVPLDDQDLPPAGARLAAESCAAVAAAGRGSGQNPIGTGPAPTPTRTPAPAREPAPPAALPHPDPDPDRVIAARASAPHTPIHNATPFQWAPQEGPARKPHAAGADLGGHQRPPLGPGRPPTGSFAPPRGNPPAPSGPLPPQRPPAPQRPQQGGPDPHHSNQGGQLVSQPPPRRPGPPPAQPPPTHPARPPRRPTPDTPETPETPETPDDTLRSPRKPLEERDATGNTRRST